MKNQSRTIKSLKNSLVALSFTLTNIILQFFSRKIFLNYLGSEVLGLNTTIVNLLQFLNLAELGIGAATTFSLYKPLKEGNWNSLNEIVSLQGHLYKRIAIFVIVGGVLLMLFFPIIFKKISLPLWYAYASFLVMLFSTLLGYFVNYRQVLLSANQEEYKITYSYKSIMIIKIVVQTIFIYGNKESGYIWWLIWESIFSLIAAISLNRIISKSFPFLKKSTLSYKALKVKHQIVLNKIKKLFFHNIGSFVLSQSSSLIIYAYLSLTIVAYYGNYMLIINGVTIIINALFNSLGAGVGNLVAEGNSVKIKNVFIELFSIRFFIVSTICFMVYTLTPTFIKLWIGGEYLLSNTTLSILTIILYISLFRFTIGAFTAAYGLYEDILAPIIEAGINISLSIILGKYYGLNGILSGVLISQVLVVALWKPYYLFSKKMKGMGKIYVQLYIKHVLQLLIIWQIVKYIIDKIVDRPIEDYSSFILSGIEYLCIFSTLLILSLIVTHSGIQQFLKRIYNLKK